MQLVNILIQALNPYEGTCVKMGAVDGILEEGRHNVFARLVKGAEGAGQGEKEA